ncbi:MAG: hypothetical protein HOK38_04325 [Flavobacteriaceae bacterium]|jgi:hypothetical protein|nr:hypothetical protein [Flavobacteriaceae bacterium]
MRFITAIIWLGIITTLFSGVLYSLIYLDLPIGEGDPVSNVSYYILSQDTNNILTQDDVLRNKIAKKFIAIGASNLLFFITIYYLVVSVLWIAVGEFLRVDRPNKAIKYIWLWFSFLCISLAVVGSVTWYLLYKQDAIWHRADFYRMIYLLTFILIYTTTFFYIVSMFITSRVLRSAVPFLTIILRN